MRAGYLLSSMFHARTFQIVVFLASISVSLGSLQMSRNSYEEIDRTIQECLLQDGTPSASVAIVRDGQIIYAEAFGKSSLKPPVLATPQTRYQLASLSKTFTAQAILLLVAQKKLSLDDTVSRWYPDLTEASKITLRQLLSHTAGYPDHYPERYPAGPKSKAAAPDSIIEEWGHHPLLFPPGTQFRYSNLDYIIAGRIVEKVSGEPLFQFFSEHIFQPVGMTAALDLDKLPENSPALATGYVRVALAPLRPAPYEGPGWSFGSGQVVTTAKDVALWDLAFLHHQTLPEPEATEEITPVKLANGSEAPTALGLFVSHQDGVTRYYHTGEGEGFAAVNLIYPDSNFALVVLCNTSATATNLKIAYQLIYFLVPPGKKEAMARQLFTGLQTGHPDESLFSEHLKQHLTASLLQDYRSSLAPLAQVKSFVADPVKTTDGMETREYSISTSRHCVKLHLLILPNGLIEDIVVTNLHCEE